MTSESGTNPVVLNIGVTGHRFLQKESILRKGLMDALHEIQALFPGCSFTVISPLAEGADRLVVDIIMQYPGAKLVVPLPMPQSEYIKDFDTAESKAAFKQLLEKAHEVILLPSTAFRKEAYEAAGLYILQHCDILVALWDGREARGQGGTGDIINRAVQSGKPVCHIWTGNNSPDEKLRTDVGEKQGQVSLINFSSL